MTLPDSALLEILSVGHITSIRSDEGYSLRDALSRVNYSALRSQLEPGVVLRALKQNPSLVDQWVRYCEDKRTSGGWYILPKQCEIGRLGVPESVLHFARLDEAVAEYVLRELDFWAGLRGAA
jgi:hypothetical protein